MSLYSDGPGGVSNQLIISKLIGIVELNTLCASLLTKEFIGIIKPIYTEITLLEHNVVDKLL